MTVPEGSGVDMRAARVGLTVGMVGVVLGASAGIAAAGDGSTTLVSKSSSEVLGDGSSGGSSISADGRYVAFVSDATDLVPGDSNGVVDVFVRDRAAGTTTRASVSSSGEQADAESFGDATSISADGRYVAFVSEATNLVPGDTNGAPDIFVRDLRGGTTTRASLSSSGDQGNAASSEPALSGNGRFLAFTSAADNLVPGDTNTVADVFVRDLRAGTTSRVSVSRQGAQGNSLSGCPTVSSTGRYVAFCSYASNLVRGDTNGVADVFVRDRQAGTTNRVSLSSRGRQVNQSSYQPAISADGQVVAFWSHAGGLAPGDTNNSRDVFVRNRRAGTTSRVSVSSHAVQGNSDSQGPSISADGRYVTFESAASTLVPGDTNTHTDIFLRDRRAGTTTRVSVADGGQQGNDTSLGAAISADGRHVTFTSAAENLTPADSNGQADVFVRNLGASS